MKAVKLCVHDILCIRRFVYISLTVYIYILLTKNEGCTGRISARGLDKKDPGPIFSQYGREQAWLIRDLLHD